MTAEAQDRWSKIEEIFHKSLGRAPEERPAFVSEACGGDEALRAEVESLLRSHLQPQGFIESPPVEEALSLLMPGTEPPMHGRPIGPYKLVREIGHGGMGTVYLAERADSEYQRRVAIKLIRPGLQSEVAAHRFHVERQILANLDHPNIARLLDGGRTEEGVPYIVMEYVDGIPIDAFCDRNSLPIPRRLALFRTICSAVHYAHQNLVVHRDIKPGNILVTADGVPKLVDFGIAKLLDPVGIDTALTSTGQGVMTLDYASPEQIRGEPITTATDVYALGVLLYVLLTGRHPYPLESRQPHMIARSICEEDPEKPSLAITRPDGTAETATDTSSTPHTIGGAREGTRERLARRLQGDLDNIVLMAIRKSAQRRYASVEQFSEDVRRHLDGLPVIARKDTISYRSAKFIVRHRAACAAAMAILLSLVGALALVLRQARVARQERDWARIEEQKAGQVNAFMQEVLSAADPRVKGRDITVAQALDGAARRLAEGRLSQPEMEASARTTIGLTYLGLGMYDSAEPHLRRALALHLKLYGLDNAEVASSMGNFASLMRERGDLVVAERYARLSLALFRKTSGPKDPRIADALNDLAGLRVLEGDLETAERLRREALDIRRAAFGEHSAEVAESLNDLAVVLGTREQTGEAERLHREALALLRQTRGPNHPDVAVALGNLAADLEKKGDYPAAESLYEEALALRRTLLGPDHPEVAWTLYNYAYMECTRGDDTKAINLAQQVLDLRGKTLPDSHPMVAASLLVLGRSCLELGDLDRAERAIRECLLLRSKALPRGHWLVANTESVLGECLVRMGRFPDAETLLLRSRDCLRSDLGPQHTLTRENEARLAELYAKWHTAPRREEGEQGLGARD